MSPGTGARRGGPKCRYLYYIRRRNAFGGGWGESGSSRPRESKANSKARGAHGQSLPIFRSPKIGSHCPCAADGMIPSFEP
jgi:hypothetical protein